MRWADGFYVLGAVLALARVDGLRESGGMARLHSGTSHPAAGRRQGGRANSWKIYTIKQRETEHRRHGSPSISVKTSITSSSSSRHLHPPPDTGRVYTNRHSQQADTGRMAPERHSQHVTSDVSSHGNEPETGRTRQQLVDILIELQKGAEQEAGIGHTPDEETQVTSLFENDIALTLDQAQEMLLEEGVTSRRRRKRKLATDLSRRWTLPIPYMFDGSHNTEEKRVIELALAYWQDLTCIQFKEDSSAENRLLFTKGNGCWSYVGYTKQVNQTISIGRGCQSNGTIAHEVGHAVGFWHEQSRPDRDEHVVIHTFNVTRGKLYNFKKRTWGEIESLDIPYDLGSDMHYGSKFYAKDENNTYTTVEPRDRLMARVIGQRQELSFYDVKLANKAYCDGWCVTQGVTLQQPCQREGYQDPQNCHKCRCPDGFAGVYCDQLAAGRNAYCGAIHDARYNGTIFSPGYPAPGYRADTQCTWLIKGPPGTHVYLQFLGDFGIAGHVDVCKDFVEVRYNTSLALTGARFCCRDPPRQPLVSDTHEMLVLFRSYPESRVCDDSTYPWKCRLIYTGFQAKYYLQFCGGCHGNYARQPACKRRTQYRCEQRWTERVRSTCLWWAPECDTAIRTVNKVRFGTCYKDELYCCNNYALHAATGTCIVASRQQLPPVPDTADDDGPSSRLPSLLGMSPGSRPVAPATRPAVWSDWSPWTQCPVTCGGGLVRRARHCLTPTLCGTSPQENTRSCGNPACYNTCARNKTVICGSYWRTCTRQVMEPCEPHCNSGYTLQDGRCV